MKAQTTTEFAVEGRGLFPFDMLRYDSCWPASERDSAAIEATTRPREREVRIVHLMGLQSDLTVGRWESFGWKIVDHGA